MSPRFSISTMLLLAAGGIATPIAFSGRNSQNAPQQINPNMLSNQTFTLNGVTLLVPSQMENELCLSPNSNLNSIDSSNNLNGLDSNNNIVFNGSLTVQNGNPVFSIITPGSPQSSPDSMAPAQAPPAQASEAPPAEASPQAPPAQASPQAPPAQASPQAPPAQASPQAPPAQASPQAPPAQASPQAPPAQASPPPPPEAVSSSPNVRVSQVSPAATVASPIVTASNIPRVTATSLAMPGSGGGNKTVQIKDSRAMMAPTAKLRRLH